MNPRLKKRMAQLPSGTPIGGGAHEVSITSTSSAASLPPLNSTSLDSSVRDEAALLLSLSDIVNREVQSTGLQGLWHEEEREEWDGTSSNSEDAAISLPKFPRLSLSPSSSSDDSDNANKMGGLRYYSSSTNKNDPSLLSFLKPRSESLFTPHHGRGMTPTSSSKKKTKTHRLRSVSIESPPCLFSRIHTTRTASPISLNEGGGAGTMSDQLALVSPVTPMGESSRRLPHRKHGKHGSKKHSHSHSHAAAAAVVTPRDAAARSVVALPSPKKGKELQGAVPKGIPITKIMRKKFSWKNYPELEAFLIANREEYLRHSALNYTVQQKQYNNRLTEQLLELATEHGYVFDIAEFSFVTVRDRIRCYFKSYVQSAKKRGVLMGYAARKAGLLTEDDLEKSAGLAGRIITPP